MGKNRIHWSVWGRLGLGVLVYLAVLLMLTWLMHQYWILKYVSLGDAMFVMGALACTTASAGMMRNNPFGVMLSAWGVPALPVQPTEAERHEQLIADFVEQSAFGVRLFAAGLLTLLLSIPISNIK